MKLTVLNYLYRDAGNHKAFGRVLFHGYISNAQYNIVSEKLDGGTLFIAEQLNIPVLYHQLYQWSCGPTSDDHCWHEMLNLKQTDENLLATDLPVWGTVYEFIAVVEAVECWDGELSPHFFIGSPMHEALANRSI